MFIVYYTNCQGGAVNSFLKKVINYEAYFIENFSHIRYKKPIPIDILKKADIFIYQPIDKKHGIYSTDIFVDNNILTNLRSDCISVAFPYMYNSSLWPFVVPSPDENHVGVKNLNYYVNHEPIVKLVQKGYDIDTILNMYENNQIDFDYKNRFDKCIRIMREKETRCDIKISDFIVKNIRKHDLFLTQNHPTTILIVYCANQILSYLGYDTHLDEFGYDNDNVCNLPGRCHHSKYDRDYWNFKFTMKNVNESWYINHIKRIYNDFHSK